MTDDLPDDVLLDIFGFYVGPCEGWRRLVHVCHRWRNLVFSSPRRLGLELLCKDRTRVRDMLHIWPALPICIIASYIFSPGPSPARMDNILAALEHSSRISRIRLQGVPKLDLGRLTAAMQRPFPELKVLEISSRYEYDESIMAVLPDSFLGGSAPRLRFLSLNIIPPRELLLSVSHIVELFLGYFPSPRYISPDVMVDCLSALKRLETLHVRFQSSRSRPADWPDWLSPPPPTRIVVPVLAKLTFYGTGQYLEDLVARIDTPLLNDLNLSFFTYTVSDIPHLSHFLSRTNGLNVFSAAEVEVTNSSISLELNEPHHLALTVLTLDWRPWLHLQLPSLALICSQLSPFLSHTEQLDLICIFSRSEVRMQYVEATLFLKLFRPFTAVQSLYVSETLVAPVVPALLELTGEMASEVLPNLRSLEIPASTQDVLRPFAAKWRLSSPREQKSKKRKYDMLELNYLQYVRVYVR
ncbi:hypothetical protein BC826DRAFT_614024 [Russula brevipes]|nr:hypothetical protein BC826DRAFT_614024 [Russula brevipes]